MELIKHTNDEEKQILIQLKNTGRFQLMQYEKVSRASWAETFKTMQVKTIAQAFKMQTPSLALLKKYKGEKISAVIVASFINDLSKNLNVNNNMKPFQIAAAAKFIMSNYHYLTVADLRLCFDNAIMGKYKNPFGRLDVQVICEWLNTYLEERHTASMNAQIETNRLHKEELFGAGEPVNKERLAEIKAFTDKLFEQGTLKQKEKIRKEHGRIVDDRTPEQKEQDRLNLEAEIKKYQEQKDKETYINFKNKSL